MERMEYKKNNKKKREDNIKYYMHTRLTQGKKKICIQISFLRHLSHICTYILTIYNYRDSGHCLEGWDEVNCFFPFIS